MHKSALLFAVLVLGIGVQAQEPKDTKTRVYVTDSESWEVRGSGWIHGSGSSHNGTGSASVNGGSSIAGGSRPQTVEIMKTIGEKCSDLTVTENLDAANFVVRLDHEGGKGLARKKNKVAVFNRDGDMIFSSSTVTLGGAVDGACAAIRKDAGLAARSK
jgi:hypothetical protein